MTKGVDSFERESDSWSMDSSVATNHGDQREPPYAEAANLIILEPGGYICALMLALQSTFVRQDAGRDGSLI